jgi:SAM-dependent methyltransferase
MIARKELPIQYQWWNTQWGAPFGHKWLFRMPFRVPYRVRWLWPLRWWAGMFGFQTNNTTREYEYPWCFYCSPLHQGMRVLEIGGSLSGFQFVLSKLGIDVINLDPGEEEKPRGKCWPISLDKHDRLNRSFRTHVKLCKCFIQDAGFPDACFDRVFAISVLEHIPEDELGVLMSHVKRVLKPNGILVATVDLFLDVQPFSEKPANMFGRNVNIASLLEKTGFRLVNGETSELYGFPAFDPERIKERVANGEFLEGIYPALAQCFACVKKEDGAPAGAPSR